MTLLRPPDYPYDLRDLEEKIAAKGTALGRPLFVFGEIDSTNDEAKRVAKGEGNHGSLFLAESQTKGRGRSGNQWSSPRSENLLFSVIAEVMCPLSRVPCLSIAVGVAIADAIESFVNGRVQIKWPNDVWIDEKKVAGILVESARGISSATSESALVKSTLVIGVGLNVHTRVFPDELKSVATSMAIHAKGDLSRSQILADVMGRIDRDLFLVAAKGLGPIAARIDQRDGLRGKEVRSDHGEGIARGIAPDGRLRVELRDGTLGLWASGEVSRVLRSGGK